MRRFALVISGIAALLLSGGALALDKVDPYICPTMAKGSGLECFLEGVAQTYTMCRQVKSIEVIEFGITGAQEGVNGAKTDYCIDKHKQSMDRPYQAALKETSGNPQAAASVRKLHDFWLQSLEKLIPGPAETDDGYKQRVARPYGEFTDQIGAIRVAAADMKVNGKPLLVAGQPAAPTKAQVARAKATATSSSAKSGAPVASAKPKRKSGAKARPASPKPDTGSTVRASPAPNAGAARAEPVASQAKP